MEIVTDFNSWAPKSPQMVTIAMNLKDFASQKKSCQNRDSILKGRDITLLKKSILSKLWFVWQLCTDVRV